MALLAPLVGRLLRPRAVGRPPSLRAGMTASTWPLWPRFLARSPARGAIAPSIGSPPTFAPLRPSPLPLLRLLLPPPWSHPSLQWSLPRSGRLRVTLGATCACSSLFCLVPRLPRQAGPLRADPRLSGRALFSLFLVFRIPLRRAARLPRRRPPLLPLPWSALVDRVPRPLPWRPPRRPRRRMPRLSIVRTTHAHRSRSSALCGRRALRWCRGCSRAFPGRGRAASAARVSVLFSRWQAIGLAVLPPPAMFKFRSSLGVLRCSFGGIDLNPLSLLD